MGISYEVFVIILLLGIPVFFIWRWLLKKYIKSDKSRIIATWIATIITAPFIYIGVILIWLYTLSYYPTNDFNKEKWLSDTEKRYEMSGDIIESEMLIGKTKSEVKQILGDDGNEDESDNWSYSLGFKPGFANIDPDVLDIEFKDGKVVKVGQHNT